MLSLLFLSPFPNARTDKYGGSLENRARFLTEIVAELRKNEKKNFLIAVKINGADLVDNGLKPEDVGRILKPE
jgi:2,4-dienoyl-CoA reductase-like NADH-dependent reductase (Old Yellow Enzyme family)